MTTETTTARGATRAESKKSVGSLTTPIIRQSARLGCPCGCASRPGFNDPDCARHRPARPRSWGGYGAADLGLVPHPRDNCDACRRVGK